MTSRRLVLLVSIALSASIAFAPGAAFGRAKTDVVFLENGDHLTGEIKQLGRGILELSTDALSTVNIEWDDVDSLHSVYEFRVEDAAGGKYFGSIDLSRGGSVRVARGGGAAEIAAADAVAITPMEASFWQQLNGSFSLGFSFTKADNLAQLTIDATVRRQTELRSTKLDASSIKTSQRDEDSQTRGDLSLSHRAFLLEKLIWSATGAAERNDELGLDLRTLLSLGVGADLVESNSNLLVAMTGLSVNREWAGDESDGENNLESFFALEHSVFRYDYPKTDITTELVLFPSLSNWGRVRGEIDVSARREVVSDLFVALSFYDSYDNEPTTEGAEENDYGLVTSIGWSF